jgi:UDP-N-acetylmuramoylalanine--D-glutamate ligase
MRYAGRRVVVAGARVAGTACARVLMDLGALVTVVDRVSSANTESLAEAGARVVIADQPPGDLLDGAEDLVVSPGFAPHHPLVVAAAARGLDIYCEPELAWRLRGPQAPPWLAVTGTNGKTTTVTMLAAMLRAAGRRADALGNIGEPLVYAAVGGGSSGTAANAPHYEVLAVELSSFQLHWSSTLAPQVGALLNLADDHLEWHLSFDAYAQAKTAIWRATDGVAVGNLDDERVAALLGGATRTGPGRVVGFTLGEPKPGQFGVSGGMLVDFASDSGPVELVEVDTIRPAGTHNVANALAAAALARVYGVPAGAVRDGLAGYTPEPHRNAYVATVAGVDYVDDSKATNPHAALASLTAYPRVVWVAGGQLKGVDVDDLVRTVADRLVGAVLLGVDRAEVAQALARHAPQVPVVDVASTDDGAMAEVVRAAARLAAPGDTVLLAPAAASLDMYPSYSKRGDAFAAAARELGP